MTTPTEQIDALLNKLADTAEFAASDVISGELSQEKGKVIIERAIDDTKQDLLSVCKTMMREAVKGIGQKAVEVVDKYIEIGEQLTTRQIEVMIEVIDEICRTEILERINKLEVKE